MQIYMFRLSHQLKVFYSIVRYISIFMMDYFFWVKIPTKIFFHYEAMFQNIRISPVFYRWVAWVKNRNIASFSFFSSAFPARMIFAFFIFIVTRTRAKMHGYSFYVAHWFINRFVADEASNFFASFISFFRHNKIIPIDSHSCQ